MPFRKRHVIFLFCKNDISFYDLYMSKRHVVFTKQQSNILHMTCHFCPDTKMTCHFLTCLAAFPSQKRHGQNDMSYDIVFYLRMGLFDPILDSVWLVSKPDSFSIIHTPKWMNLNPKMLEILILNDF